jgi:hypothetical protein
VPSAAPGSSPAPAKPPPAQLTDLKRRHREEAVRLRRELEAAHGENLLLRRRLAAGHDPGPRETRDGSPRRWRYQLWVTNLPATTKGWRGKTAYIDAAHRVHARVEDSIRTGKRPAGHYLTSTDSSLRQRKSLGPVEPPATRPASRATGHHRNPAEAGISDIRRFRRASANPYPRSAEVAG